MISAAEAPVAVRQFRLSN